MELAGQIRSQPGYAMAALLVGLSVMSILMGMALPVWSQMAKREKEEELIWRGNQYARAVGLFMRKYANTFPPTLDVLVEQKFLRKKYKDPITNDDFQLIPAASGPQMPGQGSAQAQRPGVQTPTQPQSGRGLLPGGGQTTGTGQLPGIGAVNLGISGVVSKSKESSIKIYNGRQKYNEWAFVHLVTAQRVGGAGGPFPGMPGQPGRGGAPIVGPGGTTFTPLGPGGRGLPPGGRGFQVPPPAGARPPVPFGQPGPFGQPPFGAPGQPGQPPFGSPFPQPQRPPQRPPGI